MKRKLANTLIAIGCVLVVLATGLWGYNLYDNHRAKTAADDVLNNLQQQITKNDNPDPFDTKMKAVTIDGYDYIGSLTVPTLGLNLPVMSTCDYSRLRVAPCRYYGSTKTDNLVIAAHNYRTHFGYLGQLKGNEPITFTDMEGQTTVYRVVGVEVLPPNASDQVKDTGDDLILYTCTYSGAKRIVVRCQYAQ